MRVIFSLFMSLACCFITASLTLPVCADEPKLPELTAKEVLDRMAKAYAGCKSYHDSGVVKTVFIEGKDRRTLERPFTTAFVRPGRFRFEFREKQRKTEHRYIVWREGENVREWWDIDPMAEQPGSLELGLAGATGVSGGSAHTIPALLLPNEIGGRTLMEITEAIRVEDAKFDKVVCFRIEGRFADNPITLWIDQQKFLVRRIDQHDERTEDTTTYDPAIDEEIADEKLEFDPPKAK